MAGANERNPSLFICKQTHTNKNRSQTQESVGTKKSPQFLGDHFQLLVRLDTKQWFHLVSTQRTIVDVFTTACDAMMKNLDKVKNPRGKGSESNFTYN